MNLVQLVVEKARELGQTEAAKYFGVSQQAVSKWMCAKSLPQIYHAQKILDDLGGAPDELTGWEGRQLLIGHPAYSFCEPGMVLTLIAAMRNFGQDKAGFTQVEQTLIDEARNELGRRLIRHKTADRIIMVDHDMVLPCGQAEYMNSRFEANLPPQYAGVNFISRMMSYPKEMGIVGATYVGRHPKGKIQCSAGFESQHEDAWIRAHPEAGLKQVGWVATGCIMIHKWVLEKMSEQAPRLFPDVVTPHGVNWFSKGPGYGEDAAFGLRAQKCGIASYIDCSLIAGHTGKFTFWPNNTKGVW